MNETELRRHSRLKHRAKIKVTGPSPSQQLLVDMRDFSESGLFLLSAGTEVLGIGDVVEVQTTEFEDAPVQTCTVVRIEPGVGFGVQFNRV